MASMTWRSHAVVVCGARGGHGATTTAAVLSVLSRAHYIGSEIWAPSWILGPNEIRTPGGPTVIDGGSLESWASDLPVDIAVLRGPCSIGLSTLVRHAARIQEVILIREPWRSLTTDDVESAIERPIAIEIPFSERIARLCDAGLLGARLDTLDEYTGLRRWVGRGRNAGHMLDTARPAIDVDTS